MKYDTRTSTRTCGDESLEDNKLGTGGGLYFCVCGGGGGGGGAAAAAAAAAAPVVVAVVVVVVVVVAVVCTRVRVRMHRRSEDWHRVQLARPACASAAGTSAEAGPGGVPACMHAVVGTLQGGLHHLTLIQAPAASSQASSYASTVKPLISSAQGSGGGIPGGHSRLVEPPKPSRAGSMCLSRALCFLAQP